MAGKGRHACACFGRWEEVKGVGDTYRSHVGKYTRACCLNNNTQPPNTHTRQVGRDQRAQAFLGKLDKDRYVGDLIDCTSYFENEAEEVRTSRREVQVYKNHVAD
jgi:hypothetical protein